MGQEGMVFQRIEVAVVAETVLCVAGVLVAAFVLVTDCCSLAGSQSASIPWLHLTWVCKVCQDLHLSSERQTCLVQTCVGLETKCHNKQPNINSERSSIYGNRSN